MLFIHQLLYFYSLLNYALCHWVSRGELLCFGGEALPSQDIILFTFWTVPVCLLLSILPVFRRDVDGPVEFLVMSYLVLHRSNAGFIKLVGKYPIQSVFWKMACRILDVRKHRNCFWLLR